MKRASAEESTQQRVMNALSSKMIKGRRDIAWIGLKVSYLFAEADKYALCNV